MNTAPLVFFHLPRTAGRTLIRILEKQFPANLVCPAHEMHEYMHLESVGTLCGYRFYRGHFGINILRKINSDADLITILREPVARVLSSYRYMHSLPIPFEEHSLNPHVARIRSDVQLAHDCSPDQFFARILAQGRLSFFNQMTVLLGYGRGWELDALRPPLMTDELVEKAKANLEKFSFVALTERFSESVRSLERMFGWQPSEIGRLNASSPLDSVIDHDLLAWLENLTRFDHALYAHACYLFDNRWAHFSNATP